MNRQEIASRPPGAAWLMAVSLAIAALAFWLPISAWPSGATAMATAAAGALAGGSLAAGRLRAAVVLAALGLGSVVAVAAAVMAARVPALLLQAEAAAAARDALLVAAISVGACSMLAFVACRLPGAAPIPAAVLVLCASGLLAAHRGGAIHRPYELADRAWLSGLHPGLLLAAAGGAAGLIACLTLVNWRGTRKAGWQLILLLIAAFLLVRIAPGIGALSFSSVDPLGLSGDPPSEWRRAPPASERAAPGRGGSADPLGLTQRDGGAGDDGPQPAPFRDEYDDRSAQSPVAVVILHDDVDPLGGAFYFRQVAFSQWNGRRLVRALDPRLDADVFDRFPAVSTVERPGPPASPLRSEVPTTVALMREHSQPPVLADGVEISSRPVADPAVFTRAYAARSLVLAAEAPDLLGRSASMPGVAEEVRSAYLDLPPDPRYADVAREALESIAPAYREDPWARAIAVALWLEANTTYSLRSKHSGAADPTASFLFGDRVGYCVHLAHAAAYMARALGVPARVAAGYSYSAADRASGSAILLRAGDAHAWAEVWLDGVGWTPVDPAPPSIDPPLPAPDVDLQRLLGELARPHDQRLAAGVPQMWRRVSFSRVAGAIALAVALVWIVTGHALKAWRRVSPIIASAESAGRLAYRASLDRLAEAGLSRNRGETREAFAARVGSVAPAFVTLTNEHLGATLGKRSPDPCRSRALSRDVARQLAAGAQLRRWAGVLAPWSWTRSR